MVRRLGPRRPIWGWLASSTASAPTMFYMLFAAIPVFLIVTFVAGTDAVSSLVMVVPIVVSTGLVATFVDGILFRVLLHEPLNQNKMLVLFTANLVNVSLAVGSILAWAIAHPPHLLAGLGDCR